MIEDTEFPGAEVVALPDHEKLIAAVSRLASLDLLAYERVRKDEAAELDIRKSVLDAAVRRLRKDDSPDGQGTPFKMNLPEPWPEQVDGAKLLMDLSETLEGYISLPAHAADAMALWILHAWVFDSFSISPNLVFSSPQPRCGKTTALSVVTQLVPKPMPASHLSPAVLFRVIEMAAPTVLIDEADAFLADNEEMRGLLNSSHNRATAMVWRIDGDALEPRGFSTWAPIVVALIGNLADTLRDRSIIIQMRRKLPTDVVKRYRADRPPEELGVLAQKAMRWAEDHAAGLADLDPLIPNELNDRAADNWRPLFAIAEVVGGKWPEMTMNMAAVLSGDAEDDEERPSIQILRDIQSIFDRLEVDRLPTSSLVEGLNAMEDRPWPSWNRGKGFSARALSNLLRPYRIVPGTIRVLGGTFKGYHQLAFEDAFTRYAPSSGVLPDTPTQPALNIGHSENLSDTQTDVVSDRKLVKPAASLGSVGVSDRNPPDRVIERVPVDPESDAEVPPWEL